MLRHLRDPRKRESLTSEKTEYRVHRISHMGDPGQNKEQAKYLTSE